MTRTKIQLVIFSLCMAWPFRISADPPKKLGDVCPRLQMPGAEDQPGIGAEPIIIDNRLVRKLSQNGRFAAIGPIAATGDSTMEASETVKKHRSQSKTRDRWRAEHRRRVAAIRKMALRLAIAREELAGLQDQIFNAGSEAQRIRLEPRLNRKKLEIKDLEYSLQKEKASFSRLIREARLDGAQPGWFRDLPRP